MSSNDDGILNAVEHIEAELQRLGRLVATLRRRIEASSHGASTSSPTHSATFPLPATASKTTTRPSQRRMPAAAIEDTEEETVVRMNGSGYGFVREPRTPDRRAERDEGSTSTTSDDIFARKTR